MVEAKNPEPCPTPELSLRTVKTAAERQREYRAKLKCDPEWYRAHRNYETARIKAHRARRTEEQIAHDRETARLRMQRYRQKKAGEQTRLRTRRTRGEVVQKRKKWWLQKQKQCENMSSQAR